MRLLIVLAACFILAQAVPLTASRADDLGKDHFGDELPAELARREGQKQWSCQQHERQGDAHARRRAWAAAAESYALVAGDNACSGEIRLKLARVEERLGHRAAALLQFKEYLAGFGHPARGVRRARLAVRRLLPLVAAVTFTFRLPDGAVIAGLDGITMDGLPMNAGDWVAPGSHTFAYATEHLVGQRTVRLEPGARVEVVIELAALGPR
ncbi:MAG: hypothetical protein IT370_29540 [Deltaproteobacteria bacterium]|nr:hypothetical protein [Deltaproteobacteria bacterium]